MKERSNQKLGHTHTDKNKRRPSTSSSPKAFKANKIDQVMTCVARIITWREEMPTIFGFQVIHTWEKTSKKKKKNRA